MLFSASMWGRFYSNICISVWLYFKRTCVSQWPYLREQPKTNVQRLKTFLRGFIRDKVKINLLLRPLLWILKNSSYIWKPNMHILQSFLEKQYCSSLSSYFKVPKEMKKIFLNFFAILGVIPLTKENLWQKYFFRYKTS